MIKYDIIKYARQGRSLIVRTFYSQQEDIGITIMKQDLKQSQTEAIAPLPEEYTAPLEFDQVASYTANDLAYEKNKEFAPLPEEHVIPPEFGETKKSTTKDTVDAEKLTKARKKMMQLAFVFFAVLYTPLMTPNQRSATNPKDIFALVQQGESTEASVAIDAEETSPEDNTQFSSATDTAEDIPETNGAASDSANTEQATSTDTEPTTSTNIGQTTSASTKQGVSANKEPATSSDTEQSTSTGNTSVTTEPTEEASSTETPVNNCSVCGGTGKCDECKGDGYLGPGHTVSCPRCHGSGVETCPYCDGAGNSLQHEGACDFAPCMGSHIYPCTTCNGGTTSVTCNSCGGTGKCQACSQ